MNKLFTKQFCVRSMFLIAAISIMVAWYYAFIVKLEPCPLCIAQQILMCVIAVVAFLGLFYMPKILAKMYGGLNLIAGIFGSYIAYKQIMLKYLSESELSCGMPLEVMYKLLPIKEFIEHIFHSASCAKENWAIFGISAPYYSLFCFVIIAVLSLLLIIKK